MVRRLRLVCRAKGGAAAAAGGGLAVPRRPASRPSKLLLGREHLEVGHEAHPERGGERER